MSPVTERGIRCCCAVGRRQPSPSTDWINVREPAYRRGRFGRQKTIETVGLSRLRISLNSARWFFVGTRITFGETWAYTIFEYSLTLSYRHLAVACFGSPSENRLSPRRRSLAVFVDSGACSSASRPINQLIIINNHHSKMTIAIEYPIFVCAAPSEVPCLPQAVAPGFPPSGPTLGAASPQ